MTIRRGNGGAATKRAIGQGAEEIAAGAGAAVAAPLRRALPTIEGVGKREGEAAAEAGAGMKGETEGTEETAIAIDDPEEATAEAAVLVARSAIERGGEARVSETPGLGVRRG
jgi:hypothetical protein